MCLARQVPMRSRPPKHARVDSYDLFRQRLLGPTDAGKRRWRSLLVDWSRPAWRRNDRKSSPSVSVPCNLLMHVCHGPCLAAMVQKEFKSNLGLFPLLRIRFPLNEILYSRLVLSMKKKRVVHEKKARDQSAAVVLSFQTAISLGASRAMTSHIHRGSARTCELLSSFVRRPFLRTQLTTGTPLSCAFASYVSLCKKRSNFVAGLVFHNSTDDSIERNDVRADWKTFIFWKEEKKWWRWCFINSSQWLNSMIIPLPSASINSSRGLFYSFSPVLPFVFILFIYVWRSLLSSSSSSPIRYFLSGRSPFPFPDANLA